MLRGAGGIEKFLNDNISNAYEWLFVSTSLGLIFVVVFHLRKLPGNLFDRRLARAN
jgi:hypothetical protein